MVETAYVVIGRNDDTKEIFVKQESFAYGSEEAGNAKKNEIKLLEAARQKGYNIVCDGKVIYDNISLKKEKEERLAKAKKLLEIKKKDLTELTEEEIVLLAQSRVHGDRYSGHNSIPGKLTRDELISKATTFEEEYQKIMDAIAQKKKEKEERILEIKKKDLTELTEEEIVLLAQSRVNESPATYKKAEGAYQKVMDIMDEYQRIKDAIEQKNNSNVSFDEQTHRPHM